MSLTLASCWRSFILENSDGSSAYRNSQPCEALLSSPLKFRTQTNCVLTKRCQRGRHLTNNIRTHYIAALLFATLNTALSQQKGISYFITAGKGFSAGEWGLRYVLTAGLEFPLDCGFSLSTSLNYLEFPFYTYGGLDRVLSHGTKSDISVAALLKLSPKWPIAPYIAGGLGLARLVEGEVVHRDLSGAVLVFPSRTGVASFASIKTGVEISILQDLVASVGLGCGIGLGSDLYSTNFNGQVGIRFWP